MNSYMRWVVSAIVVATLSFGVGELYVRHRGAEVYRDEGCNCSDTFIVERMNDARDSLPLCAAPRHHRALVVGCSYTFGLGVAEQDTFVWKLNEMFPDWYFENAGISGGSAYSALCSENKYLRLNKYDLVLYATIADQLDRDLQITRQVYDREDSSPNPLDSSQYQVELLSGVYPLRLNGGIRAVRYAWEPVRWPGDGWSCLINYFRRGWVNRQRELVKDTYAPSSPLTMFRYMVRTMDTLAQAHGAKYGIIDLQDYGRIRMPRPFSDLTTFALEGENQPVALHAVDVSLDFDLRDDPKYHTKPAQVAVKHGTLIDAGDHPSALVHTYYAKKIAAWLRQEFGL